MTFSEPFRLTGSTHVAVLDYPVVFITNSAKLQLQMMLHSLLGHETPLLMLIALLLRSHVTISYASHLTKEIYELIMVLPLVYVKFYIPIRTSSDLRLIFFTRRKLEILISPIFFFHFFFYESI